jgi:hypothetical protein
MTDERQGGPGGEDRPNDGSGGQDGMTRSGGTGGQGSYRTAPRKQQDGGDPPPQDRTYSSDHPDSGGS